MTKALQPYVSFTIEGNENIFLKSKNFPLTQCKQIMNRSQPCC